MSTLVIYGMDIYFLAGALCFNLYSEDGDFEYFDTVADWIIHPEYSGSSGLYQQRHWVNGYGMDIYFLLGISEVGTSSCSSQEAPE